MGVTQYTLSDWLGRQASVEEVRSLSHDTAFEIYETKYFSTPRLNTLPALIQPFMTDAAVNHGASRPIRWMQQVVNMAGFGPVDMDGVIGPQSRKATERAVGEMGAFFVNALVELRIQFFEGLAERDPP
jgi:lysozyme family protein